jgi:hypothetical protein
MEFPKEIGSTAPPVHPLDTSHNGTFMTYGPRPNFEKATRNFGPQATSDYGLRGSTVRVSRGFLLFVDSS